MTRRFIIAGLFPRDENGIMRHVKGPLKMSRPILIEGDLFDRKTSTRYLRLIPSVLLHPLLFFVAYKLPRHYRCL